MMRAVPVGGVLDDDVLDDGRGGDPRLPADMLRELGGVRVSESHADDLIEEAGLRDRARAMLTPRHAMAIIMVLVTALCASLTLLTIQGLRLSGADGMAGGGAAGLAQAVGQAQAGAGGSPETGNPGAESPETETPGAESPAAGASNGQGTSMADASGDAGAGGGLIDINTASVEELDEIKGVGPATAEKIVALRRERGGFASVEELLDVPGIGAKTLEKMRPQITVGAGRGG